MKPTTGVEEAKRTARSRLRAARSARRAAPEAARARARDAERIARAGTELAASVRAPVVALFTSMSTEPPTERLSAALRSAGARVILPRMLDDRDLTWHAADDEGRPGADLGVEAIGEAGLVLVPALAVDRAGGRLGQGGGSYDRALRRAAPGALVVALVHDDEVLDAVPLDAHDVRVDGHLTPAEGWTPASPVPPSGDNGAYTHPPATVQGRVGRPAAGSNATTGERT